MVASISSLGGTVSSTFLAPAIICLFNDSLSVKIPVDSTTISTFKSFHGNSEGSDIDISFISRSLIFSMSFLIVISASKTPIIESCLNK